MILWFEILGLIFIGTFANLLKYSYDIFEHNKLLLYLSSINDSYWENIKIIILPFLIWSFIEFPILNIYPNYLIAQIIPLFVIISIIYMKYQLCHIYNFNNFIFNIIINYLAIIVGLFTQYMLLNIKNSLYIPNSIAISVIIILVIIYYIINIQTPHNSLFMDPHTSEYGIDGHVCTIKNKKRN